MSLEIQPITFREACEFIKNNHRHHLPPRGHKFSIAANNGEKIVGIVIVGRPIARHLDNGWTAELTRCCTDGTKNAASLLYGAAWRTAKAMGYKRLVTYTLAEETGTSLKAAGWKIIGMTKGGSWNRKARPRIDEHPLGQKLLWQVPGRNS